MSGKSYEKWEKLGNCPGKNSVRENYCCNSVTISDVGAVRQSSAAYKSALGRKQRNQAGEEQNM